MTIRLPGGGDRTVIIGPTGSGKTIFGAWLLGLQRFDKRPWVALDFKGEELWYRVGDPPMRRLRLGSMPGKRGLYRMDVNPGDEDELEEWLWRVWKKENIGLFIDEVSLVPRKAAFKAILRQGRSKRIPVIACTQRPVDCDREVFSESQYRVLFGIEDMTRDYPVIKGLFGNGDIREALARRDGMAAREERDPDARQRWTLYYDARQRKLDTLRPVPPPVSIASRLKDVAPYNFFLGG